MPAAGIPLKTSPRHHLIAWLKRWGSLPTNAQGPCRTKLMAHTTTGHGHANNIINPPCINGHAGSLDASMSCSFGLALGLERQTAASTSTSCTSGGGCKGISYQLRSLQCISFSLIVAVDAAKPALLIQTAAQLTLAHVVHLRVSHHQLWGVPAAPLGQSLIPHQPLIHPALLRIYMCTCSSQASHGCAEVHVLESKGMRTAARSHCRAS